MKLRPLAVLFPVLLSACMQGNVTQESNEIIIQGSDTEVQLVSTLVEAFAEQTKNADISVAGGGSAVGIAALINEETDIANSSRKMKEEEIAQAKEKGLDPQEFILARDGLSIIVHPSNTVTRLTMEQLGKMFQGTITNWKEVGGADAPIVLYGRQSTSGTFGFFRDTVVKNDYANTMRQMEGSQAIVDGVQADTNGIGYVGVGYVKDESGTAKTTIKIVNISQTADSTAFSPLDTTAVEKGDYPIVRAIYQYLPKIPAAGSALEAFLKFEASDAGQAIVQKSGFYPVNQQDRTQNTNFFERIR